MDLSNSTRAPKEAVDVAVQTVADVVAAFSPEQAALLMGAEHAPVTAAEYAEVDVPFAQPGILWLVPSWRRLGQREIDRLVRVARERSASALVVRDDDREAVRAAFDGLGATVVCIADAVSWRQFQVVVDHALGERAGALPAAVPATETLFGIANDLAAVFGGSVTIENHRRTVLAYSTLEGALIDESRRATILARQAVEDDRNRDQYRRLAQSDDIARFEASPGQLPRAAVAVRAGGVPLGTVWVIDPDGDDLERPMPDRRVEALRAAARAAAVALVDAWRADLPADRAREDAVRRVLAGGLRGDEREALGFGGLGLADGSDGSDGSGASRSVRLLAIEPGGERARALSLLAEVRRLAGRQVAVRWRSAAVADLAGVVYALVPGGDRGRAVDAAAAIRDLARVSVGVDVSAAVTRAAASLDGVPELREEADALLRAGRAAVVGPSAQPIGAGERIGIATSDGFGAGLIADALDLAAERHPYLRASGVLGATGVADADAAAAPGDGARDREPSPGAARIGADRDAELRETVLAWLDANGNAAAAGAALSLHENSVRYRVRRACARWNLDLDDADTRFAVWTALRVARHRELVRRAHP